MESSQALLDLAKRATRHAATAVREVAWSQAYYEGPGRSYAGADDHHAAPELDQTAQRAIVGTLDSFGNYVLISEEAPGCVLSKGEDTGDLCFIADPLDGSAFARRRIPLASSCLCAYSRAMSRPIASAVTDIYLGTTYFTADHLDGAFVEHEGCSFQIATTGCCELEHASCTALGAQPSRFDTLVLQRHFTASVHWILNTGGAIDICRVAAGDLDATVEFAKGFRIWDVAAAGHILKRAGGAFAMPEGNDITLPPQLDEASLKRRYRFIAAATEALFTQVHKAITWHS
jgi:myo-inositol-1(or 4)-monophosphatase